MIRKAVIPAAGLGTRFLPATKSQPKEMLPVVDKPVIQYVVEEAVSAGITDILIITGKGKHAIRDHFDRHADLERALSRKGKNADLSMIRAISSLADVQYVRQKEINGLGDAISYARNYVGREPFAVLLGDTLVESRVPVVRQLADIYERYRESVVALERVPRHKIGRYGVVSGRVVEKDLLLLDGFVEKPAPREATSDLAMAGRYVFTPDIFDAIEKTPPGKNNEIQLTDAMREMLMHHAIYGLRFEGARYDIGNKLDFLTTNIAFALRRKDLGGPLLDYLVDVVARRKKPAKRPRRS